MKSLADAFFEGFNPPEGNKFTQKLCSTSLEVQFWFVEKLLRMFRLDTQWKFPILS